ncbi:MAG: hypothetical protein IKH96_10250 [Ruminococcus sp.]|uniref:DUF6442 family protein n=1 Tax=Ruminococcus sp. TaxID=41978 RepID=UPI0025F2DAEA|nr:DUF6442 family protein [Ruminococcus sp.]MBR6996383.1 hypothetical protein [Ruminococcus sp.]
MKREEILAKSQKEYRKHDPFKEATKQKVYNYAAISMSLVAAVIFIIHAVITKKPDFGLWAVVITGSGIECLINGISQKKKALIVSGILWLLIAAAIIITDAVILITNNS